MLRQETRAYLTAAGPTPDHWGAPTPTPRATVPGRIASFLVEGFAMGGAALHPAVGWPVAMPAAEPLAAPREAPRARTPGLREALRALSARMRLAAEIRRGTRVMEALDDRMLRDIGIERGQIRGAANLGRVPD